MMNEKQWNSKEEQSVRANVPALSGESKMKMLLRDVRHCHLRTLTLCTRAEKYREMAMQATGRIDALRTSGTPGRSKVENYVLALWEVHDELETEIKQLMEKSRQAEQLIQKLPDERHRAVLELRYLCGMAWESIAEKLHFTLRWVHVLHRDALDQLARIEETQP